VPSASETDSSTTPTPSVIAQKRKTSSHKEKPPANEPAPASVKINYILAAYSAAEMKKAVSKRRAKTISLHLDSSEPWDTVLAQLFVKIDLLLKPRNPTIDLTNYDVLFSIPRVLSKPGAPLTCEADHAMLLERVSKLKSPLVNISIEAVTTGSDKENEEDEGDKPKSKKKTARRDPATLPGNVNKTANVRLLQERWKCVQKTVTCMGVHCFVDEGAHLPLSHERIECWAFAMVCFFSFCLFYFTHCSLAQRQ
jgi:hypothetical protein